MEKKKIFLIEIVGTKEKYFLKASDIEEAVIRVVDSRMDVTGCEEDEISVLHLVTAFTEVYEIFNQVVKEILYISEIKEMQL